MKLLINEQPLQLLPSLVHLVGLHEALFLQQLHFRSLISKNMRDGHLWVCTTYDQWLEEFSFLSRMTIKRTMYNLETQGYLISTSKYNKMKIDNKKWYRIDYTRLPESAFVHEQVTCSKPPRAPVEVEQVHVAELGKPITKELKESLKIKNKEQVEMNLDVARLVINYLNEKTGKQFKATSATTKKFIAGRVKEGYTQQDFIQVIDLKVSQWNHHPEYRAYLRPSTLFNPTNFENYLNEQPVIPVQTTQSHVPNSLVLDFSQGENLGNLVSVEGN